MVAVVFIASILQIELSCVASISDYDILKPMLSIR